MKDCVYIVYERNFVHIEDGRSADLWRFVDERMLDIYSTKEGAMRRIAAIAQYRLHERPDAKMRISSTYIRTTIDTPARENEREWRHVYQIRSRTLKD